MTSPRLQSLAGYSWDLEFDWYTVWDSGKCKMSRVVFDCYTQKAVFAKILARDALVGNKMVFRVEIEMKEVWDEELSWKRSRKAGSGPPSPGHKTCTDLKPDVSLSSHHISSSQEQIKIFLIVIWVSCDHLKLKIDVSLAYISTWFRHFFIIFTSIVLG